MTHIDQIHPRIQFTDKDGYLTDFGFKFLQKTWEKLGGPDDFIEDLQNGELYEPGTTDTKLTQVINQLNELELLVELQNKESRINELESHINDLETQIEMLPKVSEISKKIEEIEIRLDLLSIPKNLESRLKDLEIDVEMNYGA